MRRAAGCKASPMTDNGGSHRTHVRVFPRRTARPVRPAHRPARRGQRLPDRRLRARGAAHCAGREPDASAAAVHQRLSRQIARGPDRGAPRGSLAAVHPGVRALRRGPPRPEHAGDSQHRQPARTGAGQAVLPAVHGGGGAVQQPRAVRRHRQSGVRRDVGGDLRPVRLPVDSRLDGPELRAAAPAQRHHHDAGLVRVLFHGRAAHRQHGARRRPGDRRGVGGIVRGGGAAAGGGRRGQPPTGPQPQRNPQRRRRRHRNARSACLRSRTSPPRARARPAANRARGRARGAAPAAATRARPSSRRAGRGAGCRACRTRSNSCPPR